MKAHSAGFGALLGRTLVSITGAKGEDEMVFTLDDGSRLRLYHEQDCCEFVTIEDICGDLADLIGTPILQAEESTSDSFGDVKPDPGDSNTWTFYRIATVRGAVTIRWHGTSNGYYSESVDWEWL